MKKMIFIPSNIVKESFFEIDNRIRRNIYIYMWYPPCLSLVIIFVKRLFIDSSNEIDFLDFLPFLDIAFLANLRRLPNIFIDVYIQYYPIVSISMGLYYCVKLAMGQTSVLVFAGISEAIVTLWSLRYILRLRQHALRKIN